MSVHILPESEHQNQMQLLKRYLHQNNLELNFSQNQNSQTLIDVIADCFTMTRDQLHRFLAMKLRQITNEELLPKRLQYIYSDVSIIDDYQKDAELVSFHKITYELVCLTYQVKLVIYSLLQSSSTSFVLNAMLINPKAVQRCLLLARIGNNFYRVQEQFHPHAQDIPSLQSFNSAKSSNLNSQEKQEKEFIKMREPFQSERIIVDLDEQTNQRNKKKHSPDYASSQGVLNDNDGESPVLGLRLKKGKSVNFMMDQVKNDSILSDCGDDVSLGNILDKDEQKELLNKCSNFGKDSSVSSELRQQRAATHQNNHLPSNIVHPGDMMYYIYMQQQGYGGQGYPGKSEPYLSYAGHSISPTKNQHKILHMPVNTSPVKSNQPFLPLHPSQQSSNVLTGSQLLSGNNNPVISNSPPLPPLEIKENERYIGRLKFFDEGRNYGFIIMEADQSDLFVHFDDLQKAGITKQKLKNVKMNEGYLQVKFSFKVMEYFGKYKLSRKAVDLIVLEEP